jgi:hypothetical protein
MTAPSPTTRLLLALNFSVLLGVLAWMVAGGLEPARPIVLLLAAGVVTAAGALLVPSVLGAWRLVWEATSPAVRGVLAAAPWLVLLATVVIDRLMWTQRPIALRVFAVCALLGWSMAWSLPGLVIPALGRPRRIRSALLFFAAAGGLAGVQGLVFGLTPLGSAVSAAMAAAAAGLLAIACLGAHETRVNVLTMAVATLVAVAGLEGAIRVSGIGSNVRELDNPEYARRFFRLTPPGAVFVNEPRALDEFGPALVEINALGTRGPEPPERRADLVLIGDSFIEARQLPWDVTLTPRLQAALDRRAAGIRVVGHGMRGWSPLLEWNWYLKVGRTLRPRTVVLFFFWNDLWAAGDEATAFRAVFDANGRPDHFDVLLEPGWLWHQHVRTLRVASALWDELSVDAIRRAFASAGSRRPAGVALDRDEAERVARRAAEEPPLAPRELEAILSAPEADLDEGLRKTARTSFWPGMRALSLWTPAQLRAASTIETELQKFAEDVTADGGRLTIVYVPNPLQIAATECTVGRFFDRVDRDVLLPPDSGVQQWLRAITSRHGIELLDPSEAMRSLRRSAPSSPPLYLRADCHWSAAGHEFMAGWLADWYQPADKRTD